jgi:hypothetical protein
MKSAQLRKLFIIPNLASCKIWELLEHCKAYIFNFRTLNRFWKFWKLTNRVGPACHPLYLNDGAQTTRLCIDHDATTVSPPAVCAPTTTACHSLYLSAQGRGQIPFFFLRASPPPPLLHSRSFYSPLHHEDLTSVSLLRPFLDPPRPTPSFASPRSSSPTIPTPSVTSTPACQHSSPTVDPLCHGQAPLVSPLLSVAPNLARRHAILLLEPSPLHLVVGSRWNLANHCRPVLSPTPAPGSKGKMGQEI